MHGRIQSKTMIEIKICTRTNIMWDVVYIRRQKCLWYTSLTLHTNERNIVLIDESMFYQEVHFHAKMYISRTNHIMRRELFGTYIVNLNARTGKST